MSLVNVLNMVVLDNPCPFLHKFSFEITFECLSPNSLEEDLEWNIVYVGSAESTAHDQILQEVQVGPVSAGIHKFVLESSAPHVEQLDPNNILGVTVVLVTCTYRDQEFVRIGYYVNNEIPGMSSVPVEEEQEQSSPPLDLSTVVRTILADKPRVTRFPIQWDTTPPQLLQQQQQQEHLTPLKQYNQNTAAQDTTMQVEHDNNKSNMSMSVDNASTTSNSIMIVSPPSSQAMQI